MPMKAKKRTVGDAVTEMLIGREPTKGATTYNYQDRQGTLVRSGSILAFGFWMVFVSAAAYKSPAAGISMAFLAIYLKIHSVASAASDAVFDSLWERINLQSKYFDARLDHIERKINAFAGKDWTVGPQFDDFIDDLSEGLADAYHDFPERSKPKQTRFRSDDDPDD